MDDKKQRMEAVLLKSKFPKEAAQVPRDDLTKRESEILEKVISQVPSEPCLKPELHCNPLQYLM